MKPRGEIRYIDFHTHSQGGGSDAIAVRNLMAGDEVPADFPANTLFSAGIHPWQLTGDNTEELQTELLLTAAHPHVVMIGEAGFDRLRGAQGEVQYRVFLFQAHIAAEMGKPMVIHCVKGWDELRRARREVKPGRPWVIHGFRGSGSLAASLAGEGFWFSLGAKGLTTEVLQSVHHEKLLLETDESGQSIAEVYRLFEAATGYDGQKAESLIRNNFRLLMNYSL
ncbi:MAG TPA: TatD family hydrolase [Bacteroidales bacterium]|nr:TatD family hydrolase [Bacteroidales bacterium]HQG21115.1 TatD family hydrolase [Bacteroidales bacterium]